jgi:hypothetical protein
MKNGNSAIKRIGEISVKVAGLSIMACFAWWAVVECILWAAGQFEASGASSWVVLVPLCTAAVAAFQFWLSAELSLVVHPRGVRQSRNAGRRRLGGSHAG